LNPGSLQIFKIDEALAAGAGVGITLPRPIELKHLIATLSRLSSPLFRQNVFVRLR